jgi:chemotaxis signal transduction protein
MDCFIFEAAGKCLGIEARYVYRIADDAGPAPVPLLPSCHVGIIYYRGDLFDVIDAGRLLGNESSLSDKTPYVILLKWEQRKLGLIPDRIVGIKSIEDANATPTVFTRHGHAIQMITPGEIWKILSGLPYGH